MIVLEILYNGRNMMNDKEKILVAARERRIEHFIHFTNALNLPNILSYGLCSKECLEYRGIDYNYNDDWRLDNLSNSISVSVTSPNYKMFYFLRCNEPSKNWVVLVLDAKQILDLDCAFCYTNAANNCISSIPIEKRKTFEAFESMFEERENQASRQELKLDSNETTDPQAEVLVFESIPVSAIQYALFNNHQVMSQYSPMLINANIYYTCDAGYYGPRRDYSFW